ncbi:hypothetical protein G6F46_011509 [Rhizopus delemar]|uniref:Rhomboid-type serine protease n=2 Tax=Rhizopus TaxID=4842 RepID=A0A9P6YU65_9FUNG|nr:hypothetical protein G6F55_010490 [Rhizopus delemar]KAG1535391.1 hypothetical protein G6F51_011563 [Rhizopus arrhizus]KAG1489763.1 hypothetical protein G6F54_011203 [Rhizopus delemar]KAG1501988.1 hypothetical protein G6F53_010959 [Rhizopus delemar]KAG1514390.1 hypothetical protein G6F52_009934 [Rhizopus delemar]
MSQLPASDQSIKKVSNDQQQDELEKLDLFESSTQVTFVTTTHSETQEKQHEQVQHLTSVESTVEQVDIKEKQKEEEEFQKLELTDSVHVHSSTTTTTTTHVLEAHDMPQRNGFQKLASTESLLAEPQEQSNEQDNNQRHVSQTDYYHDRKPDDNYYGGAHPPTAPNYPLLEPRLLEKQQAYADIPSGYNRPLYLRILIGPVRVPTFSYISMLIMIALLIFEFVRMKQLTGSVIETSPFNPMIGPSFQVLVNEGARFTPCIRSVPSLPTSTVISSCYASPTDTCTLEELCGFGGFSSGTPNQSFRLVLPIFMHAGIIHFLVNMLTHLRLGVDLEKALGTPRYALLYMASGIWGFVLSAMLSQNLSASTGCSGALFGLIGYMFIDVLVNWKILPHPVRNLMNLLMSTVISLVLGLLPGLDNFAHIGGFTVGILMGMLVAPMRPMATPRVKIITWILRVVALVLLIVLFVVTIRELYSVYDPSTICPNCKYLSCLPFTKI